MKRLSPTSILFVPVFVAVALTLFAWPNAHIAPRHLPLGVAGPRAAVAQIDHKLAEHHGAFEVHRYPDAAAARQAIRDREVYGAVVATTAGPTVMTSSAASASVAQLLSQVAAGPAHGAPVEDVVPASHRANALPSSVLPLVLAGIVTALLSGAITRRRPERILLLIEGSVLAGLTATLVVQGWLDVVGGSWPANAGALTLTVFAIAAGVAGLESLFGKAGALVGGMTMMLMGNGFAGVATGPDMLPPPAGTLGQLLPPGAGGNLLRSTGFFDGAGAAPHLAVLVVWALAGVACLLAVRPRLAPAALLVPSSATTNPKE